MAQASVTKKVAGAGYRDLMFKGTKVLNYIGICFLVVMMLALVVDVCGRAIFNMPLPGAFEIVQYAMVAAVFFCLGHIQIVGGNIVVEVLMDRAPQRVQDAAEVFNTLVPLVMFVFFAWASVLQTQYLKDSGSASGVLGVPDWLFESIVAIGYTALFLVLISDLIVRVEKLIGKKVEVEREEVAI